MEPHAELAEELQQANDSLPEPPQAPQASTPEPELSQVINVDGETIRLDGQSENDVQKDLG